MGSADDPMGGSLKEVSVAKSLCINYQGNGFAEKQGKGLSIAKELKTCTNWAT